MTAEQTKIEELIHQGRYFEAKTVSEQLLKKGKDLRIQQLHAVSLSKSGALESALRVLNPIYREDQENPETGGILGGVYKQLFRKTQDSSYSILSRDVYLKNFKQTGSYYTGINAATMSAISGRLKKARILANEVISCLEKEDLEGDFWAIATCGEAYLLLRDRARAIDHYFKARKLAGNNWGWISSVYHQLWLLNHYVAVPAEIIKVFSPPGVAAFAGHMIDHPGRSSKRFPPEIEDQVKESIKATIRTLNIKVGYSSIACGGDILFAECLIEEGGEVNFILPFQKNDFIKTSVAFAGEGWLQRFEKLFREHPVKFITRDAYENNDELFHFLGKVIFGEAVLRSQLLLEEPTLITLLSEFDLKSLKGGTRDVMKLWPFPGRHTNINPDQFITSVQTPSLSNGSSKSTQGQGDQPTKTHHLVYLLVADFDEQSSDGLTFELEEKATHIEGIRRISTKDQTPYVFGALAIHKILDLLSIVSESLPDSIQPFFRLSLQVVSIPFSDDSKISEEYYPNTLVLHSKLTYGEMYATDAFAAVLVLITQEYVLDFVGEVQVEDDEDKRAIYKVEEL